MRRSMLFIPGNTPNLLINSPYLGADAVINVRYGSSSVMQGAAEVIAYGTAVKYK